MKNFTGLTSDQVSEKIQQGLPKPAPALGTLLNAMCLHYLTH